MKKANLEYTEVNNKLPRGGVLGSNTLYCNILLSHGMNNIMAF